MTDDPHDYLRALSGQPLPGGCDHCEADQELTEYCKGVFVLTIRHDADCPILAAHQAAGGAT